MSRHRRAIELLRLALVLVVTIGVPTRAAADNGVAVIAAATGSVEISHIGDSAWLNAEQGTFLNAGDRLRTGDGAKATILLRSGKLLEVRSNTLVTITEEMGGGTGSGLAKVLKDLWNAIGGKFTESTDITKGPQGAARPPGLPMVDETLSQEEAAKLAAQVKELEAMASKPSSDPLHHFMLAVLYEEKRQYDRARGSYLKAIELDPVQGLFYDALGALYWKRHWFKERTTLAQRKVNAGAESGSP